MASLFTENFDEGSNGTTITSSNSGFTSFVTPGSWTFSNTHVPVGGGTLAGKVSTTSANASATPGNTAWASTNTTYWRLYLYVQALPNTNTTILSLRAGSTMTAEVRLTTAGALQIRNSGGVQVAVSGNLATAGHWLRVEGKLDAVAHTHQLRVFSDTNANGTAPDYDSGAVASSGSVATTNFSVGVVSAATATLYFDNIAFDNAVFPGPTGNVPPTCSASVSPNPAVTGSTITLTGTDNDPDGTIVSRAWTPSAGMTGASTATATVAAPSTNTTYTYTVTDNSGATASSTVTVSVLSSTASIALRTSAQSSNVTTAAATSIVIPTTGAGGTVVAGDLALLFFFDTGVPVTGTLRTSGWRSIAAFISPNSIGVRVWAKPILSGDPGSTVTITSTVDGVSIYKRSMILVVYSGAVVGDAQAWQDGTTATGHIAPTATAVSANAWVVNAFADRGDPGSTAITLPANLTSRQQVVQTGTAAVTARVGDDDLVGAGTVGGNVGTGTLSTNATAQATVVLEPGVPGPIPPVASAGAFQTGLEPWATFTVGGTDVTFGGATVSSIVWTQTGGVDVTQTLSSTSTATITGTAAPTVTGTTVELTKTVTDSNGLTDTDVVQLDVMPATERFVSATGVEVPMRLFSVT